MLYRHVRLRGRFSADIEWNANRWQEFVSVNGQKVAAEYCWSSVPCFSFEMHSNVATHIVSVETCVTWIYLTKAFRISIDGQSVYCEGDCSLLAGRPRG